MFIGDFEIDDSYGESDDDRETFESDAVVADREGDTEWSDLTEDGYLDALYEDNVSGWEPCE